VTRRVAEKRKVDASSGCRRPAMLASSSYSRLSRAAERSQVSTVAAGHCKAEAAARPGLVERAHDTSAGSMKMVALIG
jgi:hypothetical protein